MLTEFENDLEIDIEELETRLYTQLYHSSYTEDIIMEPKLSAVQESKKNYRKTTRYFEDKNINAFSQPYQPSIFPPSGNIHLQSNNSQPSNENRQPYLNQTYSNNQNYIDNVKNSTSNDVTLNPYQHFVLPQASINNILVLPSSNTNHFSSAFFPLLEKTARNREKRKRQRLRKKQKAASEPFFRQHKIQNKQNFNKIRNEEENETSSQNKEKLLPSDCVVILSDSNESDVEEIIVKNPVIDLCAEVESTEDILEDDNANKEMTTNNPCEKDQVEDTEELVILNEEIVIKEEKNNGNMEKIDKNVQETVEKNSPNCNNPDSEDDVIIIVNNCQQEVIDVEDTKDSVGPTDAIQVTEENLSAKNDVFEPSEESKVPEKNDIVIDSTNDFLESVELNQSNFNFGLHGKDFDCSKLPNHSKSNETYETESSCSTVDLVPVNSLLKEIQFEKPSKEAFDEPNLESFADFITPKRKTCEVSTPVSSKTKRKKSKSPKNKKMHDEEATGQENLSKDSSVQESAELEPVSSNEDILDVLDNKKNKKKKKKRKNCSLDVENPEVESSINESNVSETIGESKKKSKKNKKNTEVDVSLELDPVSSSEEILDVLENKKHKKKKKKRNDSQDVENPEVETSINESLVSETDIKEKKRKKKSKKKDCESTEETGLDFVSSDGDVSSNHESKKKKRKEENLMAEVEQEEQLTKKKKKKKKNKQEFVQYCDDECKEAEENSNIETQEVFQTEIPKPKKKKKKRRDIDDGNTETENFESSVVEDNENLTKTHKSKKKKSKNKNHSNHDEEKKDNLEHKSDDHTNIKNKKSTDDTEKNPPNDEDYKGNGLSDVEVISDEKNKEIIFVDDSDSSSELNLSYNETDNIEVVNIETSREKYPEKNKSSRKLKQFSDFWTTDMNKFYRQTWGEENFSVSESQKAMSDDPDMWRILSSDRCMMTEPRGPRCHCCRQWGHVASKCPDKPKYIVCFMCGERGHSEPRCPNKMCTSCGQHRNYFTTYCSQCKGFRNEFCSICKIRGHLTSKCPDLWRRYHLTTAEGPVIRPERNTEKPVHMRYCSGCASQGHFEYDCRRYSRLHSATLMSIQSYEPVYPPLDNPSKRKRYSEEGHSSNREPVVRFDDSSLKNNRSFNDSDDLRRSIEEKRNVQQQVNQAFQVVSNRFSPGQPNFFMNPFSNNKLYPTSIIPPNVNQSGALQFLQNNTPYNSNWNVAFQTPNFFPNQQFFPGPSFVKPPNQVDFFQAGNINVNLPQIPEQFNNQIVQRNWYEPFQNVTNDGNLLANPEFIPIDTNETELLQKKQLFPFLKAYEKIPLNRSESSENLKKINMHCSKPLARFLNNKFGKCILEELSFQHNMKYSVNLETRTITFKNISDSTYKHVKQSINVGRRYGTTTYGLPLPKTFKVARSVINSCFDHVSNKIQKNQVLKEVRLILKKGKRLLLTKRKKHFITLNQVLLAMFRFENGNEHVDSLREFLDTAPPNGQMNKSMWKKYNESFVYLFQNISEEFISVKFLRNLPVKIVPRNISDSIWEPLKGKPISEIHLTDNTVKECVVNLFNYLLQKLKSELEPKNKLNKDFIHVKKKITPKKINNPNKKKFRGYVEKKS